MQKIFYLVRHGQRIKTIGDQPLSLLGEKQAALTAKYLSNWSIDYIFSSPLLRTQQTAFLIQKELKLSICIEPLIRERANWGDDPQQTGTDFMHDWNRAVLDRDWKPKVGDSSKVSGSRLETAIHNYSNINKNHFLFVTHGGIITDFLLNVFSKEKIKQMNSDFFDKYDKTIHECSITIIKFDSIHNTFSLVCLGAVNHLNKSIVDSRYSTSEYTQVEN